MAGNKQLNRAAAQKNDEFYTQMDDIVTELRHYRKHFKGKTVLCNCDDPYESNFFKYFALNFNKLGLKKLIATCYATSPIMYTQLSLFGQEEPLAVQQEGRKPYKVEITEVTDENGDGAVDLADIEILLRSKKNVLTVLEGDGDFRSEECIELLKEADIVATNPPFSLFREYISLLMKYEKKFLIIGNLNAIHYKEVFPLLKNNEVWLGATSFQGGAAYFVGSPDLYDPKKMSNPKHAYIQDGKLYWRVNGVRWYTNMDIARRHEELDLYKKYSPPEYPKYENFDAINVNKVSEIPRDYFGLMGVPDSFLEKYNPEQFEIIGLGSGYLGQSIGITGIPKEHKLQMRGHSAAGDLYYLLPDGKPKVPYSRIIIRRKDGSE